MSAGSTDIPADTVTAASPSPADTAGAVDVASVSSPAPADTAANDMSAQNPTDTAAATDRAASTSEASLLEAAKSLEAEKTAEKAEEKTGSEEPTPAEGEAKPEDKSAEGDKKPEAEEGGAKEPEKVALANEPPAPVKYEPFKVPDGVELAEQPLKEFTDLIGGAQVPQEKAQKLVDLYLKDIERVGEQVEKAQRDTWNRMNDGWKTELRNDPDLGGSRLETTLQNAKAVVELYGGTKEQQAEYWAHVRNNGMGNFIGHIRLLHNIGQKLNVFEDFIVPASETASGTKGNKGPGSRGWYDKNKPKGNGATA